MSKKKAKARKKGDTKATTEGNGDGERIRRKQEAELFSNARKRA